jgi:hypothetical protein
MKPARFLFFEENDTLPRITLFGHDGEIKADYPPANDEKIASFYRHCRGSELIRTMECIRREAFFVPLARKTFHERLDLLAPVISGYFQAGLIPRCSRRQSSGSQHALERPGKS